MMNANGKVSAYVRASLSKKKMSGTEVALTERSKAGSLYLTIVGVPVYVTVYSQMKAQADVLESTLSMEFFTGFEAQASASAGVKYSYITGYSYPKTFNYSYSTSPASLVTSETGALDMRLYAIPQFSFYIYNLAGVRVSPKPYLGLKLWRDSEPSHSDPGSTMNITAAQIPETPDAPSVDTVTASSIRVKIASPKSSIAIQAYQVRYYCYSCITDRGWYFPGVLGFFEKGLAGSISSQVPLVGDYKTVNSTLQCAELCVSTSATCKGFAYKSTSKTCKLTGRISPSQLNVTEDLSMFYNLSLSNSTYTIRDKDPNLAYGTHEISLKPSSYSYRVSVRALNLKGWSAWSDETSGIDYAETDPPTSSPTPEATQAPTPVVMEPIEEPTPNPSGSPTPWSSGSSAAGHYGSSPIYDWDRMIRNSVNRSMHDYKFRIKTSPFLEARLFRSSFIPGLY